MRNFFILAFMLAGIICILLAIFQDMPMWAILSIVGYAAIRIAQGIENVDWNRYVHAENRLVWIENKLAEQQNWMERRFLEIEGKIDELAMQIYEIERLQNPNALDEHNMDS